MSKQDIRELTSAFKDFNSIIEKFEATYAMLQMKIENLSTQLEHKNNELELKIAESDTIKTFLNGILESIHTGVIVLDNTGIITIFNKAAEDITNLRKEDVVGSNYKEIFPEQNIRNKTALYTLTTSKEIFHQHRIVVVDDKRKDIEFSTAIVKDKTGTPLGIVEAINDVSELRKLQSRINHIETLAALGEMAASVAHEIRNPLGGIGGFAGLLNRQIEEGDSRKKLVEPIITGVDRLNNIVNNLLTFTRPQKLNVQKVKLTDVLDKTIELFRMSVSDSGKNIDIIEDVSESEIHVFLDVHLFQQILMNILKNAYDAVEEGGKVSITLNANEPEKFSDLLEDEEKEELLRLFSTVEIDITDNGIGISEENIKKLFNPFFTTKESGNGLGLAICQKIVQLHRGDISVKSQPEVGTTFTITLPLNETYEEENINC